MTRWNFPFTASAVVCVLAACSDSNPPRTVTAEAADVPMVVTTLPCSTFASYIQSPRYDERQYYIADEKLFGPGDRVIFEIPTIAQAAEQVGLRVERTDVGWLVSNGQIRVSYTVAWNFDGVVTSVSSSTRDYFLTCPDEQPIE